VDTIMTGETQEIERQNQSTCLFVYEKSHKGWPYIEPSLSQWQVSD